MLHISRLVAVLAAAAALAACKPKTEAPEPASANVEAAPKSALLTACKIKMTQPEPHEWTTYWDPAHTRTVSRNPSGVRSYHWANEDEKKIASDAKNAIPLDLVCGSDDDLEPTIQFDITTFNSSPTDVPLQPATYVIAPKASPAKNKPGEFIVGIMLFNKSMFAAKSGTLKIDRFDMDGIAGSFTIDGNEILMGSRPMHVEGTFDMPCRKAMLQGGCQSNKAEQPN
ncbi:MAG TPA: hypothetical protein VGO61_12655 [Steroidobacteraceae bacterium]|jgi:hypothetical protein|nr:hypothetical protein [Steroidobacteraceae bacterium]